MADPLSIAASVGGLALLARDIVKQVASVISTVRGATSQLQALRHSVALLYGYLESLDSMLEDQDDSPAPLSILACNKTLDKIQGFLKKCRAEQEPPASSPTPTSSTSSAKPRVWQGVKQKVRWVIDKDEVEKLCADLEKHKSVLSLALSKNCLSSIIEVLKKQDETLQHMQDIKKEQSQIRQQQIRDNERRLSKERRKMLSTVSQMRPEDSFKKHFSLHQDGTGVWFLESPEFEKFMSNPNSKLWLYGIPGAGKSVLSATIIDHISTQRTEHVALASFFCEYFNTATQTCRNIFGSIAKQLALQNLNALETLEEFFNDQTDLGQLDFNPEDGEFLNLIHQMSTNFDSTIIVIDGLDECQEDRAAVVDLLAQLSHDGVGTIKTLFASRKESDIYERISTFDTLAIAASKADVRIYVAAQLKSRFRRMCEKDPALSAQILTVLVDKSEGMFQWVRCQIDCLENLASNKQRRKALEDLPRDLHGTYERILLTAIKSTEQATIKFVERTLRWVALATRGLSMAEMSHAISVDVEDRSLDDSLDMDIILGLCSSLVREVDGDLVFSHFSVKEYLMQIKPEQGQIARFRISDSDHSILAQVCLTYLLLDDFDRQGPRAAPDFTSAYGYGKRNDWTLDPFPQHPFYRYAGLGWTTHAESCSKDDAVSILKHDLFDPMKTDQFLSWAHLRLAEHDPDYRQNNDDLSQKMYDITPLHIACSFGFVEVVDKLLCNGANANTISAVLGSPLRCAISKWKFGTDWVPHDKYRYETVRRLLKEPISRDQSRYDPLAHALGWTDEEMAGILLENGFTLTRLAVANLSSEAAPKILVRTSLKDLDLEIELSLRKKFKDLDFLRSSQSVQYGAHGNESLPIHLINDCMETVKESCSHGRLENVKSFVPCLGNRLTGNRMSEFLSQCLIEAAAYGHAEIVQFLIKTGADPTFQRPSDGCTALHRASNGCHSDIVELLLETSNDRTTISGKQDSHGLTPWMCAIEAGSVETLKLFFTGAFTVNLQTVAKEGQTAAHLAVRTYNLQMVSYLKDFGLDFTCIDDFGATPIHTLLLKPPHEHWLSAYRIDYFECVRWIFRYLQWPDMLSHQTQSGQTLLHIIAQMDPDLAIPLLQVIRDNQIFDDTRGHSLAITDSDGNTPLHSVVQRFVKNLKLPQWIQSSVEHFVDFIELLSSDNGDEREQLHVKNKGGRTPVMEFAWLVKGVEVPDDKKRTFSDHVFRVFRCLGHVRKDCCGLQEADNDKCTILHSIAACRTNFPFKEVTEYILEKSIDVTTKNSSGESALMRAAYGSQDNVDFMRLLIPRMSLPQLEEEGSHGYTILRYILKTKKAGVEDLINDCLLEQIAKSEKKDRHGRILLTYAPLIVTNVATALRLLKFAGKAIDICDDNGKNCVYRWCEVGSIVMVSALLDAGANIDAPLRPEPGTSAASDPPLLVAARSEKFDLVKYLLDRGADPLVKGVRGWQLHHFAFNYKIHGLLDILENVTGLDYDAKADFEPPSNLRRDLMPDCIRDATPLHSAAVYGDEKSLQWLSDQDKIIDANVKTQDGSTALIFASLYGHHNICKRLIELGSLVPQARNDGRTALHAACRYGNFEVCKLLLATDHDCVFQKFGKQTPLEIAASYCSRDMVKLLLEHEAEVTVAAHDDIPGLIRDRLSITNESSPGNFKLDAMRLKLACNISNELGLVDVLQMDVNPNIRLSENHETPLHFACRKGWRKAVKMLVGKNANMEALDENGDSPLMVAVRSGQWKCTKLLCQQGAQCTTRNTYGTTVLHEAAYRDDFDSLSHFLKEGIEANVKDYKGRTPLHFIRDPRCVDLLLEHGADPFIVSSLNETVAWRYCYWDVGAELLRKIFSDQPAEKVMNSIEIVCSEDNSTTLYAAVVFGNSDVVSTLIEYGAQVNGRCGPLGASLHAALRQGHVGIATTLLENGARPYRIVRDGEENAGWFWEYGYEFCLQGQNGVWMPRSL